jgi:Holliday junction resolvase
MLLNQTQVNSDNKKAEELLAFINETRDGKYTATKPEVTQVTFKRVEIMEQTSGRFVEDNSEEIVLFGISY